MGVSPLGAMCDLPGPPAQALSLGLVLMACVTLDRGIRISMTLDACLHDRLTDPAGLCSVGHGRVTPVATGTLRTALMRNAQATLRRQFAHHRSMATKARSGRRLQGGTLDGVWRQRTRVHHRKLSELESRPVPCTVVQMAGVAGHGSVCATTEARGERLHCVARCADRSLGTAGHNDQKDAHRERDEHRSAMPHPDDAGMTSPYGSTRGLNHVSRLTSHRT